MSVFEKIQSIQRFDVPNHWHQIQTIDMHTGGEPLRVIVSGFPEIGGDSVLESRRFVKENYDYLRTALMLEPRGHADMYGCILLPPNDDSADFGILFLHNEGYSTMCGHAVIAITKLAVEMGWVEKSYPETKLEIDAPCGRITSFARLENDKVESVYFEGVPSFVLGLDQTVDVPGIGQVQYDLAYGGAFYAYVNADKLNLKLNAENSREIIEKGMMIKRAVMETSSLIVHPFESDLSFLYGTIFISQKAENGGDDRNACVFAEGELDRSPTGSGVSGRMAIHHARGEMQVGGPSRVIESIVGSKFSGSIKEVVDYGSFEAVIPVVEGNAYIVGQNEWVIDPDDPFKDGFFIR